MNPSILLLRALKGTCALNCLAALHLAGPLPVEHRAIMDLTGYEDGAVRKGLHTLLVLGLATCDGDERHTAWQLAPAAQSLPLPLNLFLPSPENRDCDPLFKEEEEINITDISLLDSSLDLDNNNPEFEPDPDSDPTDPTASPQAAPAGPAVIPARHIAPAAVSPNGPAVVPARPITPISPPVSPQETFESPAPGSLRVVSGENLVHRTDHMVPRRPRFPYGRTERLLRRHFYLAFDAANIYLQFRRPLADALLAEDRAASPADGPGWLCQALGWLCYAQRRLPHVQRGAVVYISLRDRLPCDLAYLPPPHLPFDLALAWAVRGGEDEPEDDASDDDETLRVSETLRVCDRPEDQLWRAVLDRLSRELSPAVLDAQLRPARLVALHLDRCRIAVPTAQSRDWLATRLAPVLARALRDLTGRPLAIEIVVDS